MTWPAVDRGRHPDQCDLRSQVCDSPVKTTPTGDTRSDHSSRLGGSGFRPTERMRPYVLLCLLLALTESAAGWPRPTAQRTIEPMALPTVTVAEDPPRLSPLAAGGERLSRPPSRPAGPSSPNGRGRQRAPTSDGGDVFTMDGGLTGRHTADNDTDTRDMETPEVEGDETEGSTTARITTARSTTAGSTTARSTTAVSTTAGSTTTRSTTAGSTTTRSTTARSTTAVSTTAGSTTARSTTAGSTTAVSTTAGSTTARGTTGPTKRKNIRIPELLAVLRRGTRPIFGGRSTGGSSVPYTDLTKETYHYERTTQSYRRPTRVRTRSTRKTVIFAVTTSLFFVGLGGVIKTARKKREARARQAMRGQAERPAGDQTGRPSGGQTGRPSGGQTGQPSGGQTGRPSGGQTGRPSGGQTGRPGRGQMSALAVQTDNKVYCMSVSG